MNLRFRKRIKLFPGVYINIGKCGVSTSVGVNGAHVTVGNGKTRATVGVPGSGLSSTTIIGSHKSTDGRTASSVDATLFGGIQLFIKWFCYLGIACTGLLFAVMAIQAVLI